MRFILTVCVTTIVIQSLKIVPEGLMIDEAKRIVIFSGALTSYYVFMTVLLNFRQVTEKSRWFNSFREVD